MAQMHKTEIVAEVGTLIGEWHLRRRFGPVREIEDVWPVCLTQERDYVDLRQTLERVLGRWPHEIDYGQNKRIRRLIAELGRRAPSRSLSAKPLVGSGMWHGGALAQEHSVKDVA